METPNSHVILNFQSCLVNKYLSRGLFIFANNPKNLSSLPNDEKLRLHAIDQPETYFVIKKTYQSPQ